MKNDFAKLEIDTKVVTVVDMYSLPGGIVVGLVLAADCIGGTVDVPERW